MKAPNVKAAITTMKPSALNVPKGGKQVTKEHSTASNPSKVGKTQDPGFVNLPKHHTSKHN